MHWIFELQPPTTTSCAGASSVLTCNLHAHHFPVTPSASSPTLANCWERFQPTNKTWDWCGSVRRKGRRHYNEADWSSGAAHVSVSLLSCVEYPFYLWVQPWRLDASVSWITWITECTAFVVCSSRTQRLESIILSSIYGWAQGLWSGNITLRKSMFK